MLCRQQNVCNTLATHCSGKNSTVFFRRLKRANVRLQMSHDDQRRGNASRGFTRTPPKATGAVFVRSSQLPASVLCWRNCPAVSLSAARILSIKICLAKYIFGSLDNIPSLESSHEHMSSGRDGRTATRRCHLQRTHLPGKQSRAARPSSPSPTALRR